MCTHSFAIVRAAVLLHVWIENFTSCERLVGEVAKFSDLESMRARWHVIELSFDLQLGIGGRLVQPW